MRSDLDASAFFPARPEPIRNKAWPVLPYFQGRPWHWCGLSRNSPGNCRVHVEILLQRFRRLSSNKLLFGFIGGTASGCYVIQSSHQEHVAHLGLSFQPVQIHLVQADGFRVILQFFVGGRRFLGYFRMLMCRIRFEGFFKPLHCLVVPLVCQ